MLMVDLIDLIGLHHIAIPYVRQNVVSISSNGYLSVSYST